jgi:hypothetical protein
MLDEDTHVREELVATGELYEGYAPRMAEVHLRNARELEAIVAEHGWPGRSLVGEDGAHAAWVVLQHAIACPHLMRRGHSLLQDAVSRGEADPAHAAALEDRIRCFEQRPQRYGTQFDWDQHGRMAPLPLEDPARVNEFRHGVGLGPLEERLEQVRAELGREPPPADYQARRRAALDWARSVGWLG